MFKVYICTFFPIQFWSVKSDNFQNYIKQPISNLSIKFREHLSNFSTKHKSPVAYKNNTCM
jgi:hypothetical protein